MLEFSLYVFVTVLGVLLDNDRAILLCLIDNELKVYSVLVMMN